MARRHGLQVDPAWVSPTPGIVSGLGLILQAVSAPGDEVVVFPPAYHAFRKIILANDRRILDAQLVETQGRYAMDLDALRAKLSPRTKVVFLCSPHNPGGTVWSAQELRALAAFCAEHGLILVSDEIHCDLVFDGKHTPTLTAAPEIADRLITCVAATKTFNLAGAHVGACITSNPELKRRLDARIQASGLGSYNGFGMIATEAAWRTGAAWLDALLPYLARSRDLFHARIEAAVPGARAMPLASTYLAWIDFSATGLAPEEVAGRVKSRARIFASPGEQFGPGRRHLAAFQFRHAASDPRASARANRGCFCGSARRAKELRLRGSAMAARAAEFPALPRAKAPKRVHARLSQSGHGTKDRRGTFAKVEVIPKSRRTAGFAHWETEDGYNHASHHRADRSSARRRRLVRPRTLVLSRRAPARSRNGEADDAVKARGSDARKAWFIASRGAQARNAACAGA